MSDAQIQIVDEADRPVGTTTKQEAWQKGLIHRISRIMIENHKGQVLLQHRSPTKSIFPDCWDNSVAGHVDAGEDYETAATRELEEELGITGVPLQEVGSYYTDETWQGLRLKRFATTYRIILDKTPVNLGADEVSGVRWFTIDEVKKLIAEHPDRVSDGLRQVFERFY